MTDRISRIHVIIPLLFLVLSPSFSIDVAFPFSIGVGCRCSCFDAGHYLDLLRLTEGSKSQSCFMEGVASGS